jgi:hypothetical protein
MTGNGADSLPKSSGTAAVRGWHPAAVVSTLGHRHGTPRPGVCPRRARPLQRIESAGVRVEALAVQVVPAQVLPAQMLPAQMLPAPGRPVLGRKVMARPVLGRADGLQAGPVGPKAQPVERRAPAVVAVGVRPHLKARSLGPESITV